MRNTTLAELGGWALAALVCLVATIVQFVSARHADTAYTRGYAAAVDSVRAVERAPLTKAMLSPGVLAARALDSYGASYVIAVEGYGADSTAEIVTIGKFGGKR